MWDLKLDEQGLVTVVVQDRLNGEIRMLAHATPEAIQRTVETRLAHFWSRSRQELWRKGATSGNLLHVHEVWLDCDRDAVIYLVEPRGPSCHTGMTSCFFERLMPEHTEAPRAMPVLAALERTLRERKEADGGRSYTRSLLDRGPPKIAEKVREEADELARALTDEADARVVSEMADVMYHAMVGLLARGLSLKDVERELAGRFGTSGHEEKASR